MELFRFFDLNYFFGKNLVPGFLRQKCFSNFQIHALNFSEFLDEVKTALKGWKLSKIILSKFFFSGLRDKNTPKLPQNDFFKLKNVLLLFSCLKLQQHKGLRLYDFLGRNNFN